ncbi:MAG: hypothetical protein C5B51_14070 [Terriglobia bacterium]|nr:MAG: hypothetical protein C5B51_14070 [Terriglobia bacterium]
MSNRRFSWLAALAALTALLLAPASPAAAQTVAAKTSSTGKAWTPPRTADGVPDFQGVWTNNTVTPLERSKALGAKEFYTEAELTSRVKEERERVGVAEEEGRGTEPGTAEDVHYDFAQFGLDRGQAKLAWNRRTSIISGPDGRIPPLTPEARKRNAERAAKARGHEFDGPENRPLGARCIARPNVGPPLLPAAYNSNLQIAQGPGYVALEAEMIHDVRIIPTDGRPHLSKGVSQWMGDSRGHWEGNTLVIDTTNFSELNPFPGAQNLHVIERLTRVDPDTILYQFTVEDPGMWTKPWSGELPITKIKGDLYEYACNEGNYGLENTLRGARVADEEAAKAKGEKK